MCACRYINSTIQSTPIAIGDPSTQLGELVTEYDVKEYWDLRQTMSGGTPSSVNFMRGYIITVKQKLSIANASAAQFGSLSSVSEYVYPILAIQSINPVNIPQGAQCYLEDYSPKTLNTAVSQSSNAATNSSSANALQRTSGSTTSTTNSFEVSANLGFFGDMPTGGASASFGNSYTSAEESSISRGFTDTVGRESGNASSMAVKDWCAFAYLDPTKQQPSWVWAQEYPWNVIDFHNLNSDNIVELPNYVSQRLWDGTTVYPPSYLAQFGIDFTATARWIVYINGFESATDEQMSFNHTITLWQASHSAGSTANSPPVANATLTLITPPGGLQVDSMGINLPLCSLLPIFDSGRSNGAVVGFVLTEFITMSSQPTLPFRLKSSANNIYVTGSGFDVLASDEGTFTASSVSASQPAQYTIQFKVVSNTLELSLFIKHWNLTNENCILTILVNEPDPASPIRPITRFVESEEAGTGSDNVSVITLRKKDYMAAEFFDYLIMGLNTVIVTVSPVNSQSTCGYALRALSIG